MGRRLERVDKLLVLILVPCFAVSFTLCLRTLWNPAAIPSVYVATEAGAPPIVTGLAPEGQASGLAPGDRLLRVGDTDLVGVNPLEFLVRFIEASGSAASVDVVYERDGARATAELVLIPQGVTRALLPAALMFALAAMALLWRAPPSPQRRAFFLAFMFTAIYLSANFFGGRTATIGAVAVHLVAMTLVCPLNVRAYLRFPDDERPRHAIERVAPWIFLVLGPLHMSRYGLLVPPEIGVPGVTIGVVLFFTVLLVGLTRNYRRADAIGRRQMKWFIAGVYFASVPPIVVGALAAANEAWVGAYVGSLAALGLAPFAIFISIVRFNLFDIDRLISSAASYNLLLVVAVALGLVLVPRAGEWLTQAAAVDPGASQLLVAVPLAALVVVVQPRLRPWIDRAFFKERHALDLGFEALVARLAKCRDTRELTRTLGEGLKGLLRPATCVVYGRGDIAFRPLYAEGRTVPAALPAESRLADQLERDRAPLALRSSSRAQGPLSIDEIDRAALEALDAELLVPFHLDGRLVGMLCLGPKRSGDVYTSTDVRLISAMAEVVSSALARFGQNEIAREAREMQDALRRYVPSAVADQLDEGKSLDAVERDVSVLFVDIRGYTSYAQDLQPDEIFGTVNRYTETVSNVIREHGGHVVEFNGDGMMAVFGAPRALAHKEQAAVLAGREVIQAMASLPVGEEGATLSVGVGIATGSAFVGNIRAADRWIWSAIGNTTNLAARMQALTRDLGAAMVIDTETRKAAGEVASDFDLHEAVPIRGRRQLEDIFALPLDAIG